MLLYYISTLILYIYQCMRSLIITPLIFLFSFPYIGICQEIDLFAQFNGRYNYTAIGNTLNSLENNTTNLCETLLLPSSSASLSMQPNQNIIAAYLFWAGSGLGDTQVKLNDSIITADDTYNVSYFPVPSLELFYFSCYAEITNQIISEGNTDYELSELDISDVLTSQAGYCQSSTNFAGWSIYIIYEEATLPLNQINLFQGLEIINRNVQEKVITLDNINVLDNIGAKIGFLAWEGDNALNFGESISINGNVLSNPPLNLANNAFNGTNSFTGETNLYNCDLDFYNIENNIGIGDTQVEIKLTTGAIDPSNNQFRADLIILNNIITVLNSQLPDATPSINSITNDCGSRTIEVNYTAYNLNSTDPLPANTPIAFYIEGVLIAQTQTQNTIPINGSEAGTISIDLPTTVTENNFILEMIVDDDGNGNGTVVETMETNNSYLLRANLIPLPQITDLNEMIACDVGYNSATYNLTEALGQIQNHLGFQYYNTIEDLNNDFNEIIDPEAFEAQNTPESVFIKADTSACYDIFQLPLITKNCPPIVPQGFSPNNDGFNDFFKIQGLYTIFEKHELFIYNRYGTLIFKGNDALKWYGKSNEGINNQGDIIPVGTYFYVLELNDENFKTPLTGWVYVNY